ncbi:MAG: hypothetical protein RR303_04055 [Bacteroidales bacterium]
MKNIKLSNWGLCLLLSLFGFFTTACSEDDDARPYEDVAIVGVKVNGSLYLPGYAQNEATIVLPGGFNLDKVKLQVLVANGELVDFENNIYYDCKKPLALKLKSSNGGIIDYKLRVQSPPLLTNLIIEGLVLNSNDIHFNPGSIIVQIPEDLDLTAQKITLTFVNGTIHGFANGEVADYSQPKNFTVLGVDEETNYPFELILTSEPVGPAYVKSITVNGVPSDSVIANGKVLTPYVQQLTDFTNATITLECGFGNKVDANAQLTGLNLLTGANKIKVTGSDGQEIEFTIDVPKLSITPYLSKPYADFGLGSDALTALAFSGEYFVIANHNTKDAAIVPVGPNYYNFKGERVNMLSKTGSNIDGGAVTGVRKLAADKNGVILGVQLGAGATGDKEVVIWKWDNVTADPTPYIKFSQNSLGLAYGSRAAGVNVQGSLSGDAIITVGMAQKQDVFVWTVTGGVLNSTPQKLSFPYASMGYYYSVEPLPIGKAGFVGAGTGQNFNGLICLNSTMGELHKNTGIITTDCSTIEHKGRVYMAYTAFVASKGALMRVCDITDGQLASYQKPIMEVLMPSNQANGNNTLDATFAVINGKLNVGFICTNIGLSLFELEK